MKKIYILLITLLAISTAFSDLRLVGLSVQFMPGIGAGHPRLVEVISILCIITFLPFYRRLHIKGIIYIFVILMLLFAAFKPFYMDYFRSSCLVPMLLLASLINLRITNQDLRILFQIVYCVITISSFFVIISPYVDLGVSIYYADAMDSRVQRYVGFGQSLPYQACYSLLAIPVFYYIQQGEESSFKRGAFLLFFGINLIAVILTGARTAYLILIVVLLFYTRSWIKMIGGGFFIGVIIVSIVGGVYYGDLIETVLATRTEFDLAGRDIVWDIALKLIMDHPLLGIQNFFVDGRQYGQVIAHAQNGYFELVFWGGFFALFLFLAVFVSLYNLTKRITINSHCLLGAMIIFAIYMLSEILFFSVQAFYLIIMIGGLLSANAVTNQQKNIIINTGRI